ncbi:MAG: glycoside hydrolase family 127 protein, partial [Thermoprotei archaeon]
APRLEVLRRTTLRSQYELMEETGRIDNFRRASGKIKGPFRGFYFNDSDVNKWVEAASLTLAYEHDADVKRLVEIVVEEIIAAQDEDGYLNTYFVFERRGERWSNLRDMHELYCAGHLFQAAIAHYRATGRRELLDSALRLADHITGIFGPGRRRGVPGHPEVEMALVELYRVTGKRSYLDLARFFIDERGRGLIGGSPYHIDHKPFRELDELVGHAVRALYLCCGATDVYMETGDRSLYEALGRLWLDLTQRKMYITGGAGSRYEGEAFGNAYELPNERAYAETCAAVANVMWNWRMLLATGNARYADIMELALYNGALAGISLEGKHYFYVNPLADRGKHRRKPWFDCACCPPNIARLIASVPGMIYSVSPQGIWTHLYAAGRASLAFKNLGVEVIQRTDYPWSGVAEIEVRPSRTSLFSLFLRIPGWCRKARVEVNGTEFSGKPIPSSYLEVRREWDWGDVVKLSLDMPVTLIQSHPHVTYNTCRVAIKRGPIVYCLEQVDNPDCDVWDVVLPVEAKLTPKFRRDLLGGVVVIEGRALALDSSTWKGKLYAPLSEVEVRVKAVELKAVPYYAWANREPGPMTVWVRLAKNMPV